MIACCCFKGEELSKTIVRNAINSGEKKIFTKKRPHLLLAKAVKALVFCKIWGKFCGEFLYDLEFLAEIFCLNFVR